MTWIKLEDSFHADPDLLALPRGVRLLWVEARSYCSSQLSDGHIPRVALRIVTDEPNPLEATEALVAAGLWEVTESGWRDVGYLDEQMSKQDVTHKRGQAAWRAERARMHKAGDHRWCIAKSQVCPSGQLTLKEWAALLEEYAGTRVPPAHVRAVDQTQTRHRRDEVESKSKSELDGSGYALAAPGSAAPLALPDHQTQVVIE